MKTELTPPPLHAASERDEGPLVSPLGVAVCVLATLVALPVLLAGRASGDQELVVGPATAAEIVTTVDATPIAEIDGAAMFEAGARDGRVAELQAQEPAAPTGESSVPETTTSELGETTTELASESDTTAPSTTEPPTTAAPTTEPPTTAAPTTTEPPTTAAPTTEPPTTAAPTTTEPPTTAAPTTEPPTTEAPTDPDDTTTTVAEPEPSGEPTAENWADLRHCESSGRYDVVSSNGLYHGAYQFWIPTWDDLAQRSGRPDLVGVVPSQAAPADQDFLALELWRERGPQPWPVCGRFLPPLP